MAPLELTRSFCCQGLDLKLSGTRPETRPENKDQYVLFHFIYIFIVPDSVWDYILFVSFVCVSVCLSVSPFSQPCFNTETFTLVSKPRYSQPLKPIEFEVDHAMLIRLISLMSKLLKLPIS